MSYPSAAAESKAVGDYIKSYPIPSRENLIREIQKRQDDFAIYLVAWLAYGDNYDSIAAIRASNLDPKITKEKGLAIARIGDIDAMRAMHYVLADYCFPGSNATLRSNVRARLNSLWDGIVTPGGVWSS